MEAKRNASPRQAAEPAFPAGFSLSKIPLLVLAGFATLTFLFGLPALCHRLTYPLQVEQGEAINIEKGLILLRGDNLYPDSTKEGPYLYSVYPPLFSWLEAGVIRATGLVWQSGRILAFAGYLGCGILMAAWGFRRWVGVWAAFLIPLFWIFPTWAEWGTMARCDTLALFFQFYAFLFLYRDSLKPNSGRSGIVASGFLTAAAVLTKQNTLDLLLVYGLYCALKGQWKRLGIYALSCGAPLLVVFGIEQVQTKGLFYDHTLAWLNTGFDAGTFWYFIFHGFWKEAGALLVAVILLWVVKAVPPLLKIQVVVSLAGLLPLGRSLGAENYWLEFLLYGIFFLGEAVAAPWNQKFGQRFSPKERPWDLAFLGTALCLFLPMGRWPTVPPEEEMTMKTQAVRIYEKGENHLTLDLDLPVMAGKRIWIQPAEYTALVKKGTWSADPLIKDIREKKFSTIELYDIPQQYLLPEAVVREIDADYQVFYRDFGRKWYKPL